MHFFDKDTKKAEKKYFKEMWDFEDETKRTQDQYVNQEVEMWEDQLKQKAQAFMENNNDNVSDNMKQFYQQYTTVPTLSSQMNRSEQLKIEEENRIIAQKIVNKLPEDAPHWLQPYHLDFFGGFYKEWEKHSTSQDGVEYPFWYNKKLAKSVWDSPMLILTCLLMNGIESDMLNQVEQWESIPSTPFIKIKMQGPKKKDVKFYYLHRNSQRVFKDNPLQVKDDQKEKKTDKVVIENQEDQEIGQENQLEIEIENEGEDDNIQPEKEQDDNQEEDDIKGNQFQYDEGELDPNAYESLEDQKSEEEKQSNESESGSDDSFELTPEQQFFQDNQREIAQFKQMLKDLKVDALNTNWEKELPKVIHDHRYRLIPQNYRKLVYEEYINNINIELQRKKLWQKNTALKEQFKQTLERLIESGEVNSDTEFLQFHKLMSSNEEIRKQFYDQLYKEDKEFVYTEFTTRVAELKKVRKDQALQQFKSLLQDKLDRRQLNEHTKWKNVKKQLKDDQRYKDLKSSTLREKLFEEFLMQEVLTAVGQKRARLVELGGQDELIKQIDKTESKRQKKEESQSAGNFKKLLEEKVTEINIPYKQACQKIKDDARFQTPYLTNDQKFEMYKEYMKETFNKRRKEFRDLLDEHRNSINPFSSWETIQEEIKEDQRFKDFPEKSRVQTFESHKEFLSSKIKKDFQFMMNDMGTKLMIQKYKDKQSEEELIEELIEVFDLKDERFRKMGMYFEDERLQILKQEVQQAK